MHYEFDNITSEDVILDTLYVGPDITYVGEVEKKSNDDELT